MRFTANQSHSQYLGDSKWQGSNPQDPKLHSCWIASTLFCCDGKIKTIKIKRRKIEREKWCDSFSRGRGREEREKNREREGRKEGGRERWWWKMRNQDEKKKEREREREREKRRSMLWLFNRCLHNKTGVTSIWPMAQMWPLGYITATLHLSKWNITT